MAESTNVRDDQLPSGSGSAGEVLPVPAASVLLLRDAPLQVLMIRRHEKSTFVPSVWVFPGGVAEPHDRDISDGTDLGMMRVTAARELFEETGIWLGASLADSEAKRHALMVGDIPFASLAGESPLALDTLVWTSRWITPVGVPKRFDTWFFLSRAPQFAGGTVDGAEAVDIRWVTPADAIQTLPIIFPTQKNLEAIAGFAATDELLASRVGARIPITRPILVMEGGQRKIVLPEQP